MKKGLLIGLGIAALLGVLYWADNKFPSERRQAAAKTADSAASPFQTIVMKDVENKDVTLADYQGKVVLVNFWATWCLPCQTEMPWLMEFQNRYGPQGFTVLGLSMDEEGAEVVAPFLKKSRFDLDGSQQSLNYPIVLANGAIAAKFGGVLGLPTSMLFSRDGQKVKTITGLVSHEDLAKDIESHL